MQRLIVVAGLVSMGCGGGYSPAGVKPPAKNVVAVVGTLTYQGKLLENFMVSFIPSDEKGHPAVGVTDAKGEFILGTNKPRDGASIGSYKVAVNFAGPESDDPPGQEKVIDDPALLPKPKVLIPIKYTNPESSFIVVDVPAGGLPDCKIELK